MSNGNRFSFLFVFEENKESTYTSHDHDSYGGNRFSLFSTASSIRLSSFDRRFKMSHVESCKDDSSFKIKDDRRIEDAGDSR